MAAEVTDSDRAVIIVAVHSMILRKSLRGELTTLADCELVFAAARRLGLHCPSDVEKLGFTVLNFFVSGLDMPAVMRALQTVRKARLNAQVNRLTLALPGQVGPCEV